ncbi:PmoA family protein [Cytophagaceae bacterium BD1B2-1]|uniref:PmoA family protein n=2 Tax=Xanthocytophaga agilis TaxID=3048010 RepID=A0AAE3RCM4_9BACT|nr:PmoA family protein [Xanthocytophaga agilis]MDJ1505357.1 PmoA family protein [Xanthocytophaga agilis]
MKNLQNCSAMGMKSLLLLAFWSAFCMQNSASAQRKGRSQANQVTLTQENGKVVVKVNNQLFTQYLFGVTELQGCKKPVLFPILTSKGAPITRGYPLEPRSGERVDHPHHVGLWFNYGDVNEHDFWNNSTSVGPEHKGPFGTIVHTGILQMKSGKKQAQLIVTADWLDKDNATLLKEKTAFTFFGDTTLRLIDRITTLTALDNDISFKDNKEGMIAIRLARQLEHPSNKPEVFTDASGQATAVPMLDNTGVTGHYRNSEGVEGEDVWGKRAIWMDLTGKIGDENVSLVMIDHSENVGYPTYWHARGYGLYAANPLGVKAFTNGKEELNYILPAGQSVTFRYRIAIASKELSVPEIQQLAADFEKKYKTSMEAISNKK